MRKMVVAVVVAALVAGMMIPLVQAVEWETYKDPKGRFSMQYPAGWEQIDIPNTEQVLFGPKSNGLSCLILTIVKSGGAIGKFVDATEPTPKGTTSRTVSIAGSEWAVTIIFVAASSDFDSANKTYFDPMIKSVKVK
jgi:hypothetical protein